MAEAIVHIETVTPKQIENKILTIRGIQVIVDSDLAELYGIQTKRLNEQVKRNIERFPENFRFQLTDIEREEVVANCDHLKDLKFTKAHDRFLIIDNAVYHLGASIKDLGQRWCTFTLMRDFTAKDLLNKIG